MNIDAIILNKIFASQIQQYKRINSHYQVGFNSGIQASPYPQNNMIKHINNTKDKSHMIISIDAKKSI